MSESADTRVSAAPTKSFFVSMLTRDIKLEDAVLDLLDNCVDGINRLGKKRGPKPYNNFRVDIRFDAASFSITDNCGGIPWDQRNYAFRMGRPPGTDPVSGSVGVYGIGMKRAIFKMGRRCTIFTRNGNDEYEVEITPEWLKDEDAWDIAVSNRKAGTDAAGTRLSVTDIHEGVSKTFDENEGGKAFSSRLENTISTHYAYIMDKGFKVTINGEAVEPKIISLLFMEQERNGSVIRPFIYSDKIDGVEVYLAVGLTGRIPSHMRRDSELEAPTRSSEDAGWTVLCNDRAVLYCDQTEMTGWGELGVPRYHTQFIAIAGVVEFKSAKSSKLPTTTTKRGLDASSPVYIRVKKKMREGMKIFTAYTNKWKGNEAESDKHREQCGSLPFNSLKRKTAGLLDAETSGQRRAKQYKPNLPLPTETRPGKRQIRFSKDEKDIVEVARYLGDPDMSPGAVGERCFDMIHDDAES